jgi:hypothetical protein
MKACVDIGGTKMSAAGGRHATVMLPLDDFHARRVEAIDKTWPARRPGAATGAIGTAACAEVGTALRAVWVRASQVRFRMQICSIAAAGSQLFGGASSRTAQLTGLMFA